MDLRARFIIALRRLGAGMILDLTPSQVSDAACQVIEAEAAGIVMSQRLLRVPVGATDAESRVAEEIQASLGDGPCLTAESTGEIVTADEAELAHRWPLYHQQLVAQTRFRSTLSFPLRRPGAPSFAALDFYSADPGWRPAPDLAAIQVEIADLVGMLLLGTAPDGASLPTGSDRGPIERRQRVWVAVGRVMEAAGVDDEDAMALLRGYAFRHDVLLDDAAAELLAGGLTTVDVLAL